MLPLSALHSALGRADAVAVTIAMSPETRRLFSDAEFAACKPGALFINVARGGIVDQTALRAALISGQLGGAGLDVTEPEPLPADDPLWSAPNLLISPHYAGAGSLISQQRLADGAGENLERFIAGTALVNQVRL